MPENEQIRSAVEGAMPLSELVRQLALIVPDVQQRLVEVSTTKPDAGWAYVKEAHVKARLALSTRTATETEVGIHAQAGQPLLYGVSLDASYSRKYAFSAEMASTIELTIVGVPPDRASSPTPAPEGQ